MPRRKSSSGGGSRKKDESQQKGQGAQEQGGIPTVPGGASASEGACGQSSTTSTSEDARHADQPQHTEGHEEADGGGSSQATVGRKLSKKERKEAERERKDAKKQQEKERKEREKREKEHKKMEKQKTRGSSKKRNSSSESAQPPTSPNELHVPQPHPTPSEGSQGSQDLTSAQGATALEEGAKQTSEEARGDDMQTGAADDTVFAEADMRQTAASKSQQDEKDRRIAELEQQKELLAKQLEETKSSRVQKLEAEIEILQAKEAKFNEQHQEHMKDLKAALQRKHDEIERLSDNHATQIQAMQDDHSKKISQLHQERKQSEKEKDEEARQLQQALQIKEKLNQESQEKINYLRRESVQLKEELEIKLKEKKENEEELCALPPNHHLEETRKQKEELERQHAQELSQLQAALKKKEKLEEESRQEANNLLQELKAANEEHAKNVEQLRQLKEKDEREADKLRQKLADSDKRHKDELTQLQSTLKEKSEQKVNELRSELEELTAKKAEEVQQLKAELEQKDVRHTKAIADIKAEYEDKHKAAEQQKVSEVNQRVKQHDAVASGRLREMKIEIETLKRNCEEKDAAITDLTVELEKVKECQQKDHETEKRMHVETVKVETELLQHEQNKEQVAEISKKEKEHGHILESKKREIELLRKHIHQVSAKLNADKETPETVQKLQVQLQEKDHELNAVVNEIETLRSSYDELAANHKHLQQQYEQLTVEVKMKRELAKTGEWISSSDPCDTTVTVMDAQPPFQDVQQQPCDSHSEDEEFMSVKSETSLQDNLTDTEKAESQGEMLEREHRLLQVKQTKPEDFHKELGHSVKDASGAEEKVIPYSTFAKLRESFTEKAEKLTKLQEKYDRKVKELREKLEERQNQLEGERQLPQTQPSLSSEDLVEMDHDTAVQEVCRLRLLVGEKENQVMSLRTQLESFDKTAAERQELEKHTKVQSRTVMDWRNKYDAAKVEVEELKKSNEELTKRINEFEEHAVAQGELDAQKQNSEREELEGTIAGLRHEVKHLQEQLRGYDAMHQEVKENASCMLKRFKTLLGKKEAECEMTNKELTKKINDLMSELEARTGQAQVYKEDFEAERKDREDAANRKDEEIAEMQKLYSEVVIKHDELQKQLTKVLEDRDSAKREVEDSKRLVQEALDNAAKNMEELKEKHETELQEALHNAAKNIQDIKEKHETEMKICVEDAENIVAHNRQEMETKLGELTEHIAHLEEEKAQRSRERDQLQENRDAVKRERDSLKKENEALDDQRKAKEKEAELNAAQKNELQNEVQQLREQLRSVTEALQTEVREVKERLAVALADKEALGDESLAKTQQVKQYKKQVDNFRIQLAESNSRIEQYQTRLHQSENDLEYCQRDLQAREEDGESKVAIIIAQHDSEMSTLNSELGRLRREKANVEEQLRQLQIGAMQPEAAGLVDTLEREKSELNHKYTQLRDRFDGVFQHNDQLQAVLKKHNIPVPTPRQMPGAAVSRSPQAQHLARQMGQEGGSAAPRSLQSDQCYATPRDGEPDKSITSPAAIGQHVNQPPDFTPQHQLVMAGGSSVPHHGGMQRQYPHGYVGQGGTMVAPGQQNQYQQGQGYQVWHQGHQGGGVAPDCHQGQQAIRDHPGDKQNQIPQHGMGNANGTGIPGMEPQQLAVATEESGQRRVPSGPQENPLLQGINTEMHQVAAVVGREVDSNPALQSLSPQAPLDPNLVCPMCRQQFRIGEIQKYRQHVKHCHGT